MNPPDADGARAPETATRRRPVVRVVAGVSAVALLVALVGGAVLYRQLDGGIRSVPITDAAGQVRPTPAGDPYAGSALDILVIGSDTRAGEENCDIGGACGTETNADVQMLVHVARDRSNATVVSIPRDTMADLPACRDRATGAVIAARRGQINSTLRHGPSCSVAAVESLTGVRLDHFVLADFSGVVRMADAVGGVPVCVTGDVFDPLSHLRLSAGAHTLSGEGALQFVRTRYAFADSSDLGRTAAQQLYLSAVIRKLKSADVLLNPVALYAVAEQATAALTVDSGLAGIPRLARLARALNAVPQERITFVRMQTDPDPSDPNRLVPAAAAGELFAAIRADLPLTAASPTPTPTAGTTPRPRPSSGPPVSSRPSPSRTPDPLAGGGALTADAARQCAQVSTRPVIVYEGRRMTPAQAYAASPTEPSSAG